MYYFEEERICGNPGAQQQRTLQIHPTLLCNLFCKHCYSSSGPNAAKAELDVDTLSNVITDANKLGYTVVSFSGGEPLLYDDLAILLAHAKSLKMVTTITTNATTLSKETLQELSAHLDLVAISLDGPPQIHNEIRGSNYAFDNLLVGLDKIRESGIRFGFIHTVTRQNWEHLLWVAEFAYENGASLLQIHPLEIDGRAYSMMPSDSLDDDALARVYLLTLALKSRFKSSLKIQYDAASRDDIMKNPELVYCSELEFDSNNVTLADLLNFLVVRSDGSVLPIAYGFSKQYELCNIKNTRLSGIWPAYLQEGRYKIFRNLCKRVFKEIAVPSDLPFFNWYELLMRRSHELIV